ncbi:helix-turn-helix domain-containing protein [Billgrantia bachuensis]|uniref:helix-turn-helix domain-containing protein n=1 Tax=Billgrantia bachuensis TaxID=2717286 RepID=UPI00197F87C5|nr:helix-turn-helix domain-containing protein [Halomonas bachuensis]
MAEQIDFSDEDFISPEEAGKIVRAKPGTLAVWRSTKRYPLPYYKSGRAVLYRRSECLAFVQDGRVSCD